MSVLSNNGILDTGSVRVRSMVIPEMWIEAGPQKDQYDIAGLNEPHIIAKVETLLEGIKRSKEHTLLNMASSVSSSSTSSIPIITTNVLE